MGVTCASDRESLQKQGPKNDPPTVALARSIDLLASPAVGVCKNKVTQRRRFNRLYLLQSVVPHAYLSYTWNISRLGQIAIWITYGRPCTWCCTCGAESVHIYWVQIRTWKHLPDHVDRTAPTPKHEPYHIDLPWKYLEIVKWGAIICPTSETFRLSPTWTRTGLLPLPTTTNDHVDLSRTWHVTTTNKFTFCTCVLDAG